MIDTPYYRSFVGKNFVVLFYGNIVLINQTKHRNVQQIFRKCKRISETTIFGHLDV